MFKGNKFMYCPNCGKENSEKQRFCRSCGLGLQAISQALADELSPGEENGCSAGILNREQKGSQNPLIYGFLMLMVGAIIGLFGKKIFFDKTIADIGTL